MDRGYRKEVKEFAGEAGWNIQTVFLKVIIPLIILSVVLGGIFWGIKIVSQPAKVIGKVLDADNILYNYEWFKQTYQDVRAIDLKIKNAKDMVKAFKADAGARESWAFEDKTEYSRLNAIFLGLQNQRADIVATYNARSKMASRSIFKTGELPEQLN